MNDGIYNNYITFVCIMTEKFSIVANSEEDTRIIAQKVAPLFHPGDVLVLDGDLGAGKTCFVKGFTDGLHAKDGVNSPTFSIANFYRTLEHADVLHIDVYRIATVDEFNDLGLSDYFDQSIVLIEWGKKFMEIFDDCLIVSFHIVDDNKRILTFECQGDQYKSTITGIEKSLKGFESC